MSYYFPYAPGPQPGVVMIQHNTIVHNGAPPRNGFQNYQFGNPHAARVRAAAFQPQAEFPPRKIRQQVVKNPKLNPPDFGLLIEGVNNLAKSLTELERLEKELPILDRCLKEIRPLCSRQVTTAQRALKVASDEMKKEKEAISASLSKEKGRLRKAWSNFTELTKTIQIKGSDSIGNFALPNLKAIISDLSNKSTTPEKLKKFIKTINYVFDFVIEECRHTGYLVKTIAFHSRINRKITKFTIVSPIECCADIIVNRPSRSKKSCFTLTINGIPTPGPFDRNSCLIVIKKQQEERVRKLVSCWIDSHSLACSSAKEIKFS